MKTFYEAYKDFRQIRDVDRNIPYETEQGIIVFAPSRRGELNIRFVKVKKHLRDHGIFTNFIKKVSENTEVMRIRNVKDLKHRYPAMYEWLHDTTIRGHKFHKKDKDSKWYVHRD